eukprot:CAMPEP_0113678536 /NCGR_PEP_ID=MMETSP0038_2-20120614/10021_1 /TAXON_ID=2898 /ORGANISM="Cryptomonas paramecium" /LENGTH=204 /DNA_ID=CAMNT_0000596223 /DNA_START=492 /DNA_END=1102 /DNA_ORIENTATION=+ /assembly_acc=CAM_ASM_000170
MTHCSCPVNNSAEYQIQCYSFVALVKSWRKEPGRAHDDHTATADDEACQVTSQRMESGSTQQGWSPCYPGREGWALFSLSRADSCPFRSLWSGLGGGSRARARLATISKRDVYLQTEEEEARWAEFLPLQRLADFPGHPRLSARACRQTPDADKSPISARRRVLHFSVHTGTVVRSASLDSLRFWGFFAVPPPRSNRPEAHTTG